MSYNVILLFLSLEHHYNNLFIYIIMDKKVTKNFVFAEIQQWQGNWKKITACIHELKNLNCQIKSN